MQQEHTEGWKGAEREFHSPRQVEIDQEVFLFAKVRLKVFYGEGLENTQKAIMASLENYREFGAERARNQVAG